MSDQFDPNKVERHMRWMPTGITDSFVLSSDFDTLLARYRALQERVSTVVTNFEIDEKEGYHSRDREYALAILKEQP